MVGEKRDTVQGLTNRFHVAVRLFSNRSQMTLKCGKNKKVAHEAIAECVTDIFTTYLFYIITKQLPEIKLFFIPKVFNITRKPAFAPPLPALANTKKAVWRDLLY